MKIRALVLGAVAAGGMSASAFAQNFQFEGGLNYLYVDPEFGQSDDAFGIDGTFHFAPVQTAGRPLAEAGFLTRSSNLSASYFSFDRADLDILTLGGEYYVDNLYFAAEYQRNDNGFSTNDWTARVGFLTATGLRLAAGFGRVDNGVEKENAFSVDAKHVMQMVGDAALNLEASFTYIDDDFDSTETDLTVDYYFTHHFSAGVNFTYEHNDVFNEAVWTVGARHFFTPVISGEAAYSTNGDDDVFGLRVAMRF